MATAVNTTTSTPGNAVNETVSYRVMDDHYIAKQLPYLQERAPISIKNELIEMPSNAPPTLPSPSLFPGEVLRMKQHRAVCMDVSNEPLVGVVYLTNFRIIFNGTPITAPDVYELLRDMQYTSSSSHSSGGNGVGNNRLEASASSVSSNNNSISISKATASPSRRTFRRKKKFTDPRMSKFYIGDDDCDGGDIEEQDEGGDSTSTGDSLPTKVMKKITTLKRTTENTLTRGIKTEQSQKTQRSQLQSMNISLPLSNPNSTDNNLLSSSAPSTERPLPSHDHVNKPVTLPRPVPPHPTTLPTHLNVTMTTTQTTNSCKTVDSGFVDPSLSKPPSVEHEQDSVFLLSTEVDFERSVDDITTPATYRDVCYVNPKRRRYKRPLFYSRPDSLINVESDSDSDIASDRYFGSIDEGEESPSDVSSPKLRPLPSPEPRPLVPVSLQSSESHPLRESYVRQSLTEKDQDPGPPSQNTTTTENKPSKPPRRKNKFHKKSSNDSDTSKDDSSTSGERSPVLSPQQDLDHSEDKLPKVLVKPRSNKHSVRRVPPPPPRTLSSPPTSTYGQPTVTTETDLNRNQPVAQQKKTDDDATPLELPRLPLADSENLERVSQTSSMFGNCPLSANSLNKRFTMSGITDERYTSGWGTRDNTSNGKKVVCNTWSDPRLNTKLIPYIQYAQSTAIPISSLHMVKSLPGILLESVGLKLPDGVLLISRTFAFMKLYLHPLNTFDSIKLKETLESTISVQMPIYKYFAFKYRSAIKTPNQHFFDSKKLDNFYSFEAEFERLRILHAKVENSQIWRVTTVSKEHPELCRSYPEKLVVLLCTPDMDLIRGANVYQEGRFPTACWMHPATESVLLRGAATKSERGQQGTKLWVDEAILHAIRKCNRNDRLFVFTEKPEPVGFQDPTKLTADAARSYYYHNCNFSYVINPPTFKSVRHSFNKLQAMIINNVSEYDYLAALDSTKWLSRISELLETSCKVCKALTEESAHVLVCYESGWDRTTQVTSLSQLLADPYYRTMKGFQVLIQKEWLWFGHPFNARHGYQKTKVKKESPLFIQWLDCVYQVMRQFPLAFEFNENLLLALVDQSYSDQFGTFLMNSERERQQCFMVPDHYHQSVNKNTVSLWSWISIMNATNRIFYNPLHDEEFHAGVIYPKYYQTCLELWTSCYERSQTHMDNGRGEINQLLSLYNDRLVVTDSHSFFNGGSGSPILHSSSKGASPTPSPIYGSKVVSRTKSDKLYPNITEYLRSEGYDPSICHHVTISQKTCQGFLVKEGGVMKNWKRRWFVLDFQNEYFTYFETMEHYQRSDNPKGVISLDQIKKVSLSTKREHLLSNLFQVKTPTRIYNIKAPSIISMEIWMACLKLPPSALK